MKKQNLRNTIVGAVIGIAILAAVAVAAVLIFNAIIIDPAPDPVPNADFGLVAEVYHPYTEIPIDDLEGDADVVSVDCVLPNYSDDVYHEFAPISEHYFPTFFSLSRSYKDGTDALTLHLSATVHADAKLVQTSNRYYIGERLDDGSIADHAGYVEKLIGGEWVYQSALAPGGDVYHEYYDGTFHEIALNTLAGRSHIATGFPLHEPGTYRLTYNFRRLARTLYTRITTGDELYTVSHTLTIPEASGKKFDVVSVDVEHSGGVARVAALIRSNDGTIPMQYLTKTKLEKLDGGEWVDASDKLTELYEIVGNDYSARANVQYEARHPFTDAVIENLFCGVAEFEAFDGYDADVLYRLTLEFIDGPETDAARYALQINLDLS